MAKKSKDQTPLEKAIEEQLNELASYDANSEDAAAIVKNIKALYEAMPPQGKPWYQEHLGAIITTAGSIIGVGIIVGAESFRDRILSSKAFPLTPKPHN